MPISVFAHGAVAKHYPGIFTSLLFGNHFGTSGVKVGRDPTLLSAHHAAGRSHAPPSPNSPHGGACSFGQVSKPDMCQRIGAVALVDDSLDYARQCSQAGISSLL